MSPKKEKSQHIQEEASASEKPIRPLPLYPNVMMVGTRGNLVISKEQVIKSLQHACEGAAYNDVIMDKLIIDNTTAGKGQEDSKSIESQLLNQVPYLAFKLMFVESQHGHTR